MEQFYPKPGETFSLTLNGGAPKILPVGFIETVYGLPSSGSVLDRWKADGKQIVGGAQTCQFKLVSVGTVPDRQELITRLLTEGRIPQGQWIIPFKEAFPRQDTNGPVGVADAWVRLEYPTPDMERFMEGLKTEEAGHPEAPLEMSPKPAPVILFPFIYFPTFLLFDSADRQAGFPADFRWLMEVSAPSV